MIEFPRDFFWGASCSAYQVEGNNINSDWWQWERNKKLKESSGQACRHYELYKEDFDLAKQLHHNAHRLSIEWSRIEPEENRFSQEIQHYLDVVLALRQRNIEPIVTLHHFTNPLWFTQVGGWLNKNAPDYFLRYVSRCVEVLCDKVNYWVTINEPMVYVYLAYILGIWPPQEKSLLKARRVIRNLSISHIRAYKLIHAIYKQKNLSAPLISIAHNMQAFVSCDSKPKNRLAIFLRDKYFNFEFIDRLVRHKTIDFMGINYYARSLIDVKRWGLESLLSDTCKENHQPLKKNSLGWDIYPAGLYDLLMRLKRYNLAVFILENGICTEDDNARWDFIIEHLKNLHLAMSKGIKVLGYLYWSLLDNYEWDKGFSPRFGLIEIDYHTYKRTVRESAKRFALVCKDGVIK